MTTEYTWLRKKGLRKRAPGQAHSLASLPVTRSLLPSRGPAVHRDGADRGRDAGRPLQCSEGEAAEAHRAEGLEHLRPGIGPPTSPLWVSHLGSKLQWGR